MDSVQKWQVIEEYCGNEMTKLKQICDPIIHRGGIPQMEADDLYSAAQETLLDTVKRYDASQGCSFQTFLTGNIMRTFYDWIRDSQREKRCNLQKDRNNRVMKDENNRPIVIHNVSIDAIAENATFLHEKIASDFNMEDELLKKCGCSTDDKIEEYLSHLSKRQRRVVRLLSEGYGQDEIREVLHMDKKAYMEDLQSIRAYENIRILL